MGGFPSHRATPSYHPTRSFPHKPSTAGYRHITVETAASLISGPSRQAFVPPVRHLRHGRQGRPAAVVPVEALDLDTGPDAQHHREDLSMGMLG